MSTSRSSPEQVLIKKLKSKKVRPLFESFLASLAMGGKVEELLPQLQVDLEAHGLSIKIISLGSNNAILSVCDAETPVVSVILQHTNQSKYMEDRRLELSAARLPCLGEEYDDLRFELVLAKDEEMHTAEWERRSHHLIIMKHYKGGDLNALKKRIADESDEKKLVQIAKVMGQLSDFLSMLGARGYVCTDIKEGNILLDESGDIHFTDMKSFKKAGLPEDQSKNFLGMGADTTRGYISADFQKRNMRFKIMTPPEEIIQYWEKEYSYQMAMMIYRLATGDESLEQRIVGKDELVIYKFNLNFDEHEIFHTPYGQMLKAVILNLCADHPENRIPMQQGARELNVLVEKMQKEKYKHLSPEQLKIAYLDRASTRKEKGIISSFLERDQRKELVEKEELLASPHRAIKTPSVPGGGIIEKLKLIRKSAPALGEVVQEKRSIRDLQEAYYSSETAEDKKRFLSNLTQAERKLLYHDADTHSRKDILDALAEINSVEDVKPSAGENIKKSPRGMFGILAKKADAQLTSIPSGADASDKESKKDAKKTGSRRGPRGKKTSADE